MDFSVAAIATACAGHVEWTPELAQFMAPVQVNPVCGAASPSASPPSRKPQQGGAGFNSPRGPAKAKERRASRFPPLRSHDIFAERPAFPNRDVLSRSPDFLAGVHSTAVPVCYVPLDKSVRLSAATRRKTMELRDKGSIGFAFSRHVGECWYMDWTRRFDESPSKNKGGLVFPEKTAEHPSEGLEWLRNFVHRTTRHDLLEVHGDSDTSWMVPGRGQNLNSAVVE